MITSLTIQNYRLFEHFTLDQIARVNLVVGTNSSGKSSLLEAIYLLTSNDPLSSLIYLLNERGEYASRTIESRNQRRFSGEYFAPHIFYGHELAPDRAILIEENLGEQRALRVSVGENRPVDNVQPIFLWMMNQREMGARWGSSLNSQNAE